MSNEFGDRNCAMALANSSFIKQIQEDTGTSDEFGMFLEPLGDNTWYPSSNSGPTMFGYKGTEHEDLVKEFLILLQPQRVFRKSLTTLLHTQTLI